MHSLAGIYAKLCIHVPHLYLITTVPLWLLSLTVYGEFVFVLL